MASRGKAARRRRTATSGGVGRGRKRRQQSVLQRYMGPIAVAGIVALVAVLVVGVVYSLSQGGASDFEFEVYQGQDIVGGPEARFADVLSLGKPIVLNFWAGNCPPCRFEMPDLERSYQEHRDEIIFLGIDVGVFTDLGSRQNRYRGTTNIAKRGARNPVPKTVVGVLK